MTHPANICENVNHTTFGQHCLLKYITQPFLQAPNGQWHQNLCQLPVLAAIIGEFGYNVDVINWNDDTVRLGKLYDLVIDISPHNRHVYERHLSPGCRQVLFATGSSAQWQYRQESARLEALAARRGIRLSPASPLPDAVPPPDRFDAFWLIGNQHTLSTYGSALPAITSLIQNTGYPLSPNTDFSQKSPRNFLFFASHPQVLKGLDLLLEVFAAHPEVNLFVCSLFGQEADFCRAFDQELFHRPNIQAVGFVDILSESFCELVRRCSYVILPSCSEGISGSVLTAMSAGLIPVVSRECGLGEDEAYILDDCSLPHISAAVRQLAGQSAGWLRAQSFRAMAIAQQRYHLRHYILTVRSALEQLTGTQPNLQPPVPHPARKRSELMLGSVRVGIPLTGGKGWLGGVSYIEMLVRSLTLLPKAERPQLFLVITAQNRAGLDCYQSLLAAFDGFIYLGSDPADLEKALGQKPIHCLGWDELFSLLDFYYPVNSDVLPYRQAVSWIPDFQHRYLPEFFSGYEYQHRETQFNKIAEQAGLVILNSQAAAADFRKYYPVARARTKVLSARPLPEQGWYDADPTAVAQKYSLPERFILCSNQFWVHKNHSTLFQAISLLKQAGRPVHLVCTGPTEDYRAPGYFETLQGEIDTLGIRENITILGLIPRADQLQLLRRSLFVVQPSLFEGLSLIVQECRSFGKALVLSDLDVHREYGYGTVFTRDNPQDLADKITQLSATCQPGPDREAERQARAAAVRAVETLGREFCALVLEQLGCPVATGAPPAPEVTILTSLRRENIANQQTALAGWRRAGFRIVALNAADDIVELRPHFPDVEFVAAYRDARHFHGKPCVYLRDLLNCCNNQPTQVCGIVKSDILFKAADLPRFLAHAAAGGVVYGSRIDITAADSAEGVEQSGSFDYIFFDKRFTDRYPEESFCLGLPWWDYWLLLLTLAYDIPAKRLTSPVAYHVEHARFQDITLWRKLGLLLSRYAETDYAVTEVTMAEYQQLLFHTIRDNSSTITLDD